MTEPRPALLLLAVLGLVHVVRAARRRRLPDSRWFYRRLVLAGPLAVVALVAGWGTTEVGLQPWVAYGVVASGPKYPAAGEGGQRRFRSSERSRGARPAGFEPATSASGGQRSIH